ncbi:uncharacterized protein LOC120633522 [Pararge aegeria]|uniref:uncharacterized protein LOC120633522 n=1 Tax=Pararge aegeria TaxID=116150 RepID=UPI0019D1A0F4|nr:uncharacterized protein LOC120633522 [Pararge aegeria]
MNYIGSLTVFDHKTQEWQVFYGRLNQFMKLNKVTVENKCALLLTHLSDETYRLARNLVLPNELDTVKFEELVEKLNNHFRPKRSTLVDRAKFYDAAIFDGESIENWAARLRGLAVYCEFEANMLDTLLRDKFVLGLKVGRERDRLFEQDSRSLTFAKAVEIAQQAACARAGRPISTDGASSSQAVFKEEPVYKVRERRKNGAASSRASSDSERCEVCGMRNHQTSQCRFKNWKCKGCGSQGHLIKMCRNTKESVKSQLHNLEVVSDENDDHDCKECDMFNMS